MHCSPRSPPGTLTANLVGGYLVGVAGSLGMTLLGIGTVALLRHSQLAEG